MPTLTAIPSEIQAGDSYAITLSLSDYPAPTWAVTFSLAGAAVLSITSTASDTAHVLTLTAAQTATLGAGTYRFRVRVSNGTSVETVETGSLTVLPDIGAMAEGEGVSWAEKTLAVVEAALSNTLADEMKMYMIAGRQVMTFSPAELMRLRSQLRAEVALQRGRPAAGGTIQTVFARR